MQKKIDAEEEKETELYDKFMCYCENGAGALSASVDAAEKKIPEVESSISTKTAEKEQLDSITAFLSDDDSYAPQSGQITGILKQMKDTMEAGLSDAEKGEAAAIANYEELM